MMGDPGNTQPDLALRSSSFAGERNLIADSVSGGPELAEPSSGTIRTCGVRPRGSAEVEVEQ